MSKTFSNQQLDQPRTDQGPAEVAAMQRSLTWLGLLLMCWVNCSYSLPRRALLLDAATASANAKAFEAHQCLWSPAAASAEATAVASTTGGGTAVASASATALSTSSASAPAGTCSLNPSYFFSLSAQGLGPTLDSERLLLQITAMRYACLKHEEEPVCSGDQANWCLWEEAEAAGGKGHCSLHFGDGDFVHFLMWSGTKLACVDSKVSQIVQCSFGVSPEECAGTKLAKCVQQDPDSCCTWTEGACYPGWYGKIVTKPGPLSTFKSKVYVADPEVWGTCVATDLFRQYSSICNHYTEEDCKKDPVGCVYVPEYKAEVASNPLNFSKPCMISSARFPLESVYLGAADKSSFAAAVMHAQKGCTSTSSEKACNANTTSLNTNVLEGAMAYAASKVNSTSALTTGALTTGHDLAASWGYGMPVTSAPAPPTQPAAPPGGHINAQSAPPPSTPPEATTTSLPPAADIPALAPPPFAPLPPLGSLSTSGASAVASGSGSSVSLSTSAGAFSSSGSLKNPDGWLKPIHSSELLNDIFGTAEYNPGQANYPGTKKAVQSRDFLIRRTTTPPAPAPLKKP